MTEEAQPEYVTYRVESNVAWVMLNRPQYSNAQNYRLLTQLDDAFRDQVGVCGFFLGVHQELVRDRRRLAAIGREVVALVAQHADQLGRQRIVEQLDDGVAVRTVAGRDGAPFQILRGGGLDRVFVERHGAYSGAVHHGLG